MAKAKTTTTQKVSNFAKNRKARIEKHLKKHPSDSQASVALRENKQVSTRKAPVEKLGWLKKSPSVVPFLRGSVTKQSASVASRILRFLSKHPFQKQLKVVGEGFDWYILTLNQTLLQLQKLHNK